MDGDRDEGNNRAGVRVLLLAAVVALTGLAAFLLIPHYGAAAGGLAGGILVLIVLKHLGLLAIILSPTFAIFRLKLAKHFGSGRDTE